MKKTAPDQAPWLLFLVGSRYASPAFRADAAAQTASENQALALFEEIERRFPRSGATPDAAVESAKIHKRRGNQARVLALWEKIALLKPTDFDSGQMALRDAQATAVYGLGAYYMKQEKWAEALKWWRHFRAGGFCGNEQEAAIGEIHLRIYQCLSKLGQQDEAVKTLEEWTFASHIESTPGMTIALAEHCRQRGQLTMLEKRLQAEIEENKYATQAAATLAYIDLLNARDKKDAAALWKPVERKSHHTLDFLDWNTKYGGKFLTELGRDAEPFLLQKAPFSSKSEYNDESAWACLLLAKMRSSAVLPVIKSNLRVVNNASYLKYQLSALALLGDAEAYAIVQEVARTGKSTWKKQAAAILELFPPGQTIEFLDSEAAMLRGSAGFKPEISYWAVGKDFD